MSENKSVSVSLPGREEIHLEIEVDGGQVKTARLRGIGGPRLLDLLEQCRPHLQGPMSDISIPEGTDPAAILMRELLLKAKGEWDFPFKEEELCHCRAVECNKVDMAVISGAHTPEKVSALTSASTACGTCRPDVEAIINYRLNKKAS